MKPTDKPKPPGQPKKFATFSASDSWAIESAFQKLADEEDKSSKNVEHSGDIGEEGSEDRDRLSTLGRSGNSSLNNDSTQSPQNEPVTVPVNEDFLFDVDIDNRELAPAYWLGPIYEVRRATWFYTDGPCDENLATQLEEGYLKTKPWRYELTPPARSSSRNKTRPASWKPVETVGKLGATNIKPPRVPSVDDAQNRKKEEAAAPAAAPTPPKFQLQTHRLFGAHMNSVVTYQDATVAWILTDDFMSRMNSTMYQRFAGGGHFGGRKVTRGYTDGPSKEAKPSGSANLEQTEFEERGRTLNNQKRRSAPPSVDRGLSINIEKAADEPASETKRSEIERRMATIVGSPAIEDPAAQEEEARKREENEISDDYRESDGDEQGREIEHLVLVTHGIGQRLGLKMESLNFIHDVNVLRKTLKSVYSNSPDLQALNLEVDKLPKNCRVQVLPVVWRHLLDFPKQGFKRTKEQDLSDADSFGEELEYPRLSDITVDGVPAIRNLVEDLFLDILLYQSSYREHIAGIVQKECNRVYKLFMKRNPHFNGKISLVGHSLGSAIMFDLLCRQKEVNRAPLVFYGKHGVRRAASIKQQEDNTRDLSLDFAVEDFYCLGSPIGLFQMLKGRSIAGRRAPDIVQTDSPMDPHPTNESYLQASTSSAQPDPLALGLVSSPKCAQIFNIFHPSDPIAYRVEPLISPAMKTLKPQPLPYVKRGIFGAPGAGLTGIGVRVGQSVSGFWSNIASGLANNMLNRSLGLTNDPETVNPQTRQPLSMIPNASNGGSLGVETSDADKNTDKKKTAQDSESGDEPAVEHPTTLLDTEIETLYSGYQRRRTIGQADGSRLSEEYEEWQDAEDRAKQLRREEAKVRALNSTGRVDFSIQELVYRFSRSIF